MRAYLLGDAASFELLARRHYPELYQFAVRFTGSAAAAEDVVQETLVQMHSSAESFDADRRFKPWLFTIAANKARDWLRRRNRRRELPLDAEVDRAAESGRRFVDLFTAEEDTADAQLHLEERREIVRQAVEHLPLRLREVLVLAYYHRFAYQEIGDILGIPLGTVKSRLHTAVASFRTHYEALVRERDRAEP